jgi:hypothetical protein
VYVFWQSIMINVESARLGGVDGRPARVRKVVGAGIVGPLRGFWLRRNLLAAPPPMPITPRGSLVAVVVLVGAEIVERRDLAGEQAVELAVPVDGVGQVDVERRQVDV